MTFIEFFDKTCVENICACLSAIPERVIFLGDKKKELDAHATRYEKLFAERGQTVDFICKSVNRNNLKSIVALLSDIVEKYGDCAFGLTGGDGLFLTAAGIVYERYKDKNVQLHRYNINNNKIYDCDNDGNVLSVNENSCLSVKENVRIYGGDVVEGKSFGTDRESDILSVWDICRKNVKAWNAAVNNLKKDSGICKELEKRELISFDGEKILYKNETVKHCLSKAGMALEMIVFLAAKQAVDTQGNFVYNDCMNGVCIDWDGSDEKFDTKNEIDVMLMRGMMPIFISCKNGAVETEELYKLNSVAQRFGGAYSKKILFSTALSGKGEFSKYFRQRAKDMDIRLIENIQYMSYEEIKNTVKNLWIS
ncbi:MAG: DUF1887 family protein [Clostridia bacterium]|nr:DUF1887 family protein [Clostridia bacterium]